jgi:NifU-like protein involved in Fe-S cluster formation
VSEVGLLVRACALGQASSSLLAANILGRTPAELAAARDGLTTWLAREGDAPDWPGMDIFTPALDYTARHPSIRLAFEAAAEAADTAAKAKA